ncbi:MAG: hypothetical protein IPM63_04490 [Acidobacteriota bacterium]|nr:MAG: hypothetical protein IPM63_04490 [Acidobacteriota bacterium]
MVDLFRPLPGAGSTVLASFVRSPFEKPHSGSLGILQEASTCAALGYNVPFRFAESGHADGAFLEERTYEIPGCAECPPGDGGCGWLFIASPSSYLEISPNPTQTVGPSLVMPIDFDFAFGSVDADTSVTVDVLFGRTGQVFQPIDQAVLRIRNVPPRPPVARPMLSVTPRNIDLGEITTDSATAWFKVRNSGSGVSLDYRATMDGRPFSLELGDSVFGTLSPGEEINVSVVFFNTRSTVERYCPEDPGDSDYRICTATVRVSGAGMLEEVTLRARVPRRSHLEVDFVDARTTNEIVFDLGRIPPNGVRSKDLTIANSGGITELYVEVHPDLNVGFANREPWRSDTSAPGQCGSLLGFSLGPGQSCIVTLQFDSTGKRIGNRVFEWRWEIRSGEATGNITVVLRATTEPAPRLEIEDPGGPDPTVDFGRIAENEERQEEIKIVNLGDSGSRLTGDITLDPSTSFSLVDPAQRSFDLGRLESATFQVRYSPQNHSAHTSRIRINHNDELYSGPDHVKLQGEATSLKLFVLSFVPGPVYRDRQNGNCYRGDGLGYGTSGRSFRTAQSFYVDLIDGTPLPMVSGPTTGVFQQIGCGTVGIPGAPLEPIVIGNPATLDPGCLQKSSLVLPTNIVLQFTAECQYPLASGLQISNHHFTLTIDKQTKEVSINGEHDGWPAYEIWGEFNGARVTFYEYYPPAGANEDNLADPIDVTVNR